MAHEWAYTHKVSDENSKNRSDSLEEQMLRAKEEAARKYQEFLALNPEHTEPETRTIIVESSYRPRKQRTAADYKKIAEQERQKNIQNRIKAKHEREAKKAVVSLDEHKESEVPTYASELDKKLQEAKRKAEAKAEQYQKEQFMQTMYGGAPIAPPVSASNQRVIEHERKRQAAKYSAEHYAESREKAIKIAKEKAAKEAKKQIRALSPAEQTKFKSDIQQVKQHSEHMAVPELVRTGKMTMEEYDIKVRQRVKEHNRAVRAGEIQPGPSRPCKTQPVPAQPLTHLLPKAQFNSTPLVPPCSKTTNLPGDSGIDVDLNAIMIAEEKHTMYHEKYERRLELYKERRLRVANLALIDISAIAERPYLLGFLTIKLKINYVGELLDLGVKSVAQLCMLNNIAFTKEDYDSINKELKTKYKLTWKK